MKQTISKNDFIFHKTRMGHYRIVYASPVTGKTWTNTLTDMTIIDKTKNVDNPKRKDLEMLKWLIKNTNS